MLAHTNLNLGRSEECGRTLDSRPETSPEQDRRGPRLRRLHAVGPADFTRSCAIPHSAEYGARDTVGYSRVTYFDTPGCGTSSGNCIRQHESTYGSPRVSGRGRPSGNASERRRYRHRNAPDGGPARPRPLTTRRPSPRRRRRRVFRAPAEAPAGRHRPTPDPTPDPRTAGPGRPPTPPPRSAAGW